MDYHQVLLVGICLVGTADMVIGYKLALLTLDINQKDGQ
jgi:hypothetical protein